MFVLTLRPLNSHPIRFDPMPNLRYFIQSLTQRVFAQKQGMLRAFVIITLSFFCLDLLTAQISHAVDWENSEVFNNLDEARKARLNGVPVFRLDLSKRKLKAVPPEIWGWTELREIVLDRNKIKFIGPELEQLAFLERLSINSNQLEQFPAVLTQLDQLISLEMGDNMIDTIPLDIDRMKALESLELWDNVLAYFPASLSDLPNLRKLDLLHNDMIFEEQESLRDWFSDEVELILSAPCRCDFDE